MLVTSREHLYWELLKWLAIAAIALAAAMGFASRVGGSAPWSSIW